MELSMTQIFSPDASGLYQKIWNLTRDQLSVKYPFFHSLLWNFIFQESDETSTAGTDGHIIYFCPAYLVQLFQKEPDALEDLLLHTLYHCLFLHLILEEPPTAQADTYSAQLWKKACDLAVERLIHKEQKEYHPTVIYQELLESQQFLIAPLIRVAQTIINSGKKWIARHFWSRCKISGITVRVVEALVYTVQMAAAVLLEICRRKSFYAKSIAMIFAASSNTLPFNEKNCTPIWKVLITFPTCTVWNIMATCL